MAGLDDLFAEIPVQDIANRIGADEGDVNNAIRTLVPALVGGLAENVQANEIDSSELESAVAEQGASDLLDGGVSVDQVDAKQGDQYVARIFGGNDSNAVASALAGKGPGRAWGGGGARAPIEGGGARPPAPGPRQSGDCPAQVLASGRGGAAAVRGLG